MTPPGFSPAAALAGPDRVTPAGLSGAAVSWAGQSREAGLHLLLCEEKAKITRMAFLSVGKLLDTVSYMRLLKFFFSLFSFFFFFLLWLPEPFTSNPVPSN